MENSSKNHWDICSVLQDVLEELIYMAGEDQALDLCNTAWTIAATNAENSRPKPKYDKSNESAWLKDLRTKIDAHSAGHDRDEFLAFLRSIEEEVATQND